MTLIVSKIHLVKIKMEMIVYLKDIWPSNKEIEDTLKIH